jgi:kinesin family protein 3/17
MEGIRDNPELRGIIPNAFEHIFGYIKRAGASQQFLVRASCKFILKNRFGIIQ